MPSHEASLGNRLDGKQARCLIERARQAQGRAYAPYSGFHVGAAVMTADGHVYEGANVENAAFGTTVCAERVAILRAVFDGHRQLSAIAVVCDGEGYARPCGVCRQVMVEFSPGMRVVMAASDGSYDDTSAAELLPNAFGLAPGGSAGDQGGGPTGRHGRSAGTRGTGGGEAQTPG